MNWYKTSEKLEKVAFRNPLDILSNELARRSSIKIWKDPNFKSFIVNDEEFPLLKKINIKIFEIRSSPNIEYDKVFTIDGLTGIIHGLKEDYLKTFINFVYNPKKFNKENWIEMYNELVNAIRHELEHAFSNSKFEGMKGSVDTNTPQNTYDKANYFYKYLTNISERESFVKGFLLEGKKRKVPAEDLFKEYLLESIFGPKSIDRDKTIEKSFEDKTLLQNGLTIREMYDEMMKKFIDRLGQVKKGFPSPDLKIKQKI